MLLSVLALDPPSAALLANSKVDADGSAHDLLILQKLMIYKRLQLSSKSHNRAPSLEVIHLLPDVMAAKTKDADLMVRDHE